MQSLALCFNHSLVARSPNLDHWHTGISTFEIPWLMSVALILKYISRTSRNVPVLKWTHLFICSPGLVLENSANEQTNEKISLFHFTLAFLYHLLADLSLTPITLSLPHPTKYCSWCKIRIFCLAFSSQNVSPDCFRSLSGSLMCVFVHTSVEGEEIGEDREKREKRRLFDTILDNCASAAVALNDPSKSGSCVDCTQIS